MNINYQIIPARGADGKYHPDWDALITGASSPKETLYLECLSDTNPGFAYNMVYVTQMTCGHYELFQTPQNEHYPLASVLDRVSARAAESKCTACVCNWRGWH